MHSYVSVVTDYIRVYILTVSWRYFKVFNGFGYWIKLQQKYTHETEMGTYISHTLGLSFTLLNP